MSRNRRRNTWRGGWAANPAGTNFDYEIEKGPAGPWFEPTGRPNTNPAAPTAVPDPAAPTGPTAAQQSAWAYMQQLLDQYGLGSLGTVVQNLIAGGMTDAAQLQLELGHARHAGRHSGGQRYGAGG